MKEKVTIHFILDNEIWAQRTVYFVPRVGDEVRFNDRFFSVLKVVWPQDEQNHIHSRANIQIEEVEV